MSDSETPNTETDSFVSSNPPPPAPAIGAEAPQTHAKGPNGSHGFEEPFKSRYALRLAYMVAKRSMDDFIGPPKPDELYPEARRLKAQADAHAAKLADGWRLDNGKWVKPEDLQEWDRQQEAMVQYKRQEKAAQAQVTPSAPSAGVDQWGEPLDFLSAPMAPPLARNMFPPLVADYAWLRAKAAGHDPGAYGFAMIGAAAMVIDDRIKLVVNAASRHLESARLWAEVIGSSSAAKTPSIMAATQPIVDQHAEWARQYQQAKATFDGSAKKKDKPGQPKPIQRQAFSSDATIEAMSTILEHSLRGTAMLVHEIDAWLLNFDAYKSTASGARGNWIAGYDGGGHQINRISRGNVWCENWSINILTATTVDKLQEMAKTHLPPDGLFARFLSVIAQPDTDIDHTVSEEAVAALETAYANRIKELLLMDVDSARVTMSDAARKRMEAWRAKEKELIAGATLLSKGLGPHIGKGTGHLARIALTMHMLEHGIEGLTKELSDETLARAERLLRALWAHSYVIYMDLLKQAPAIDLARAVANSLLAKGLKDGFSIPIVRRKDISAVCGPWRTADDRDKRTALAYLEEMGWLRAVSEGRKWGSEPTSYELNPEVWERFRDHGEQHRRLIATVRENIAASVLAKGRG